MWLVNKIVGECLMPPLSLILLGSAGILLLKKRPRLGRSLIIAAFVLLYLLSMPIVSESLHRRRAVEIPPALAISQQQDKDAGAIVVLSCGIYFNAPEYNFEDTIPAGALERLRYAARLYRELGKPILICGGKPFDSEFSESFLMKQCLEEDFRIPVRWIEEESKNTSEGAQYSYEILSGEGISKIYLITHTWHMPRSQTAFESAGFQVIPAPIVFPAPPHPLSPLDFLPGGLSNSRAALHEWLGHMWYNLKRLAVHYSGCFS